MKALTVNKICNKCVAEGQEPNAPSLHWHACPYKVELWEDQKESLSELCDCCDECVKGCCDDI